MQPIHRTSNRADSVNGCVCVMYVQPPHKSLQGFKGITQSVDRHLSSVVNKLTSLECSLNEQTLNVEIIYKYL